MSSSSSSVSSSSSSITPDSSSSSSVSSSSSSVSSSSVSSSSSSVSSSSISSSSSSVSSSSVSSSSSSVSSSSVSSSSDADIQHYYYGVIGDAPTTHTPAQLEASLTPFNDTDISNVSASDTNYQVVCGTKLNSYVVVLFEDDNTNNSDFISRRWKGYFTRSPNVATAYLDFCSSTVAPTWVQKDSNGSADAFLEIELQGSEVTSPASYWKDVGGGVYRTYCALYQKVI